MRWHTTVIVSACNSLKVALEGEVVATCDEDALVASLRCACEQMVYGTSR